MSRLYAADGALRACAACAHVHSAWTKAEAPIREDGVWRVTTRYRCGRCGAEASRQAAIDTLRVERGYVAPLVDESDWSAVPATACRRG